MKQFNFSYLETPIGMLEIKADRNAIFSILFFEEQSVKKDEQTNNVIDLCKAQLLEYFNKERTSFNLPLQLNGTDFQNKVWMTLQHIPFGKTISYLQLAINLGDEKCIRAAGMANGKNPFAIVIPCHRVIGKDGSLTGYAGGLWRKQWLLEHENAFQKQATLFV